MAKHRQKHNDDFVVSLLLWLSNCQIVNNSAPVNKYLNQLVLLTSHFLNATSDKLDLFELLQSFFSILPELAIIV